MDVTNENFVKQLPEITETIQNCDFIAIDTELSGLMREASRNRFDLPEERFAKSVESSRGYFIMQFGLSCFTRINDLQYTNKTYNFYIFPQPHKFHGDINRTFSLQANAIQFLSEHGFDFNKLFKHGVSFLTFQEKKLLTAKLKDDSKARSKVEFDEHGVPEFVPSTMSNYCRDWLKKINKFVEARKEVHRGNGGIGVEANSNMSISTNNSDEDMADENLLVPTTAEDRLELKDCNSRHRVNIMKKVIDCLPSADNLQASEISSDDETYLVVDYMDKNVKNDRLKRALTESKGFLEVIELIIVNKKPIVGHNLSLDLIQIINQFMEPLSDDYNSFKETCQSLFPLIYDTKYIAHSILDPKTLTQNQSRLNDLYCQLRDSTSFPKLQIEHLGITFDENQLAHQAGYDAYMSGFCFIVLCEAHIRSNPSKKHKANKNPTDANKFPALASQRQIVDEFANKIHLSYSYDFKYFDLERSEREPDRDHVFYLEFPSTWSLDDLFQIFHQHGGAEVSKLSKTSALCALRDRKQTKDVIQKAVKRTNYKIHTYESYLENYKTQRPANDDSGDVIFSTV